MVLAVAMLLSLIGCGDPQAGTSTQTENHLALRELRLDSILPSDDASAGPIVVTLRLDRANFDFADADSTGASLAIELLDGSPLPFRIVFWDHRSAVARLQVRIDSVQRVRRSTIVLRWNAPVSIRSDSASVWRGMTDQRILALTSVLVDDFEDGRIATRLPVGDVWTDSATDSSRFTDFGVFDAPAGHGGKALHFAYAADSNAGGYVLIKSRIAAKPSCLRSLDSIVLWMRGSGVFTLAFESVSEQSSSKAWRNWSVDSSSWKRIVVRPGDFMDGDDLFGNVGWLGVRDSVTHITLFMTGSGEFWLDDIRLHGIVADDLR